MERKVKIKSVIGNMKKKIIKPAGIKEISDKS